MIFFEDHRTGVLARQAEDGYFLLVVRYFRYDKPSKKNLVSR